MKSFPLPARFRRFFRALKRATLALFAETREPASTSPSAWVGRWIRQKDGSVVFKNRRVGSASSASQTGETFASSAESRFVVLDGDDFPSLLIPAPPASSRASIGAENFALERVALPNGVRTIGRNAFQNARFLKTVRFPSDLETIEFGAFMNSELETATLPPGLRTIESCAFCGCKLTTVALPDGLETLADSAFSDCRRLTAFCVGEKSRRFRAIDGVLFNRDATELIRYPQGKTDAEYVVPASVEKIAPRAFENCRSPTSITLPPNLESIGDGAFGGCRSLKSITLLGDVRTIGRDAFGGRRFSTTATLPNGTQTPLDDWLRTTEKRQANANEQRRVPQTLRVFRRLSRLTRTERRFFEKNVPATKNA